MKARPRRVENQVADYLSAFFVGHGHDPVERIPILGRTGPDLTINSVGLVVDVKSRKSIPKCFTVPAQEVNYTGRYFICRLSSIERMATNIDDNWYDIKSKMVDDWYDHMDEWTKDNQPNGITALVLHRTGSLIVNSTLVLEYVGRFSERVNTTE